MDNNFIQKVKKEYPDSFGLHKALDDCSHFTVGAYLDQEHGFGGLDMSPEEILSAIEEDRIHDIKEAAKKSIRRKALFDEWEKQG